MTQDTKHKIGDYAIVTVLLTAVGLYLALSVQSAFARGRKTRIPPHAAKKYHKHCYKHRHAHEAGSEWHDRYIGLRGRWERMRRIVPAAPTLSCRTAWEIDSGDCQAPQTANRPKHAKHRHCFRHAHSHSGAGYYHKISRSWRDLRIL